MIFFRRRINANETLRQNAMRFVATVENIAKEQRYVQMFPHMGFHGRKGDQYGWIAMSNQAWRELVLHELCIGYAVREAAFVAPDHLDGWTFHAVSIVPMPRVALLNLEDKL